MALNKIGLCTPTIDMIQSDDTKKKFDMIYKNENYTEKKISQFFPVDLLQICRKIVETSLGVLLSSL